jgi:RND family efflux transporter MFP subunit
MVRERHVTAGQYLAAGSPAVTIVRVHPLRLRVSVPERDAQSVRVNQVVQVTVEGDTTAYTGRVARISPAIDEASRTLMVEAEIPNPEGVLRPGSFANASIVSGETDRAIIVPTSALVTFAGVDKVLSVKDGKVIEKRVTVGRRDAERIEIVNGLAAGDPVIARPGNLVEGTLVRVAGAAGAKRGTAE